MATYQDLENRGGTIYNQATGQGYPTPEALAADLGIAPHQIDWSQITAAGGQGNTGSTTANPITSFNTALMGKLKSYQGLTSADLIKRQSAILKKMYAKQSQITPEEQRVLSPSQQSAIRGGQVSALAPELEATKGQILDRKEAQKRFLETIGIAQDMSKQLEDVRTQQRDTALQALEIRAQAGDAMTPQEVNDLVNLTGWDSQTVQSYFDVASQKAQSDRTLQDLKIAGARKDLAKPYYKPEKISSLDESLTAGQVRDIKYLPNPPQWYLDKISWRPPMNYSIAQKSWDVFRAETVSGTTDELDELISQYLK
uniref:Uncharacterized protein n=1 Tax=viral metagenome TaxID=1070528 RepID=A0A6H1ZEZ8_9ZZZZ